MNDLIETLETASVCDPQRVLQIIHGMEPSSLRDQLSAAFGVSFPEPAAPESDFVD